MSKGSAAGRNPAAMHIVGATPKKARPEPPESCYVVGHRYVFSHVAKEPTFACAVCMKIKPRFP